MAVEEIENGGIRNGVWVRAYSPIGDDAARAQTENISLCIGSLNDELTLQVRQREFFKKLWSATSSFFKFKTKVLMTSFCVSSAFAPVVIADEDDFSFINGKIFVCSSDDHDQGHLLYFGEGNGYAAVRPSLYWHYFPVNLGYRNAEVMVAEIVIADHFEKVVSISRLDGRFHSMEYSYEMEWMPDEEACSGCVKWGRSGEYSVSNRFSGQCEISQGPETFEKLRESLEEPKAF